MDFRIIETGNGGDFVFQDGDVMLISEVYNQPYLARFGGNVESSTLDNRNDGDLRTDYWANELLMPEKEQLNSSFEKALRQTELSSAGRIKLERSAINDLEYLQGFAVSKSSLIIPSNDRVTLKDYINQGDNSEFSYIWNEAKDEII